uniref:Uncharacterized protein n=1 Tax=Anopheles darlingi TaxID=43151 RepID=A0A2M4D7A3_ANODA
MLLPAKLVVTGLVIPFSSALIALTPIGLVGFVRDNLASEPSPSFIQGQKTSATTAVAAAAAAAIPTYAHSGLRIFRLSYHVARAHMFVPLQRRASTVCSCREK